MTRAKGRSAVIIAFVEGRPVLRRISKFDGAQRMMTLQLPASRRPITTGKIMASKKRKASKTKWCVFKMTKAGRRKVSCHKFKRTAKAAAKRKGGRVIQVRK